eukprot:SAG22_NODE_273_length_13182_cov_12.693419_12_plen_196_part_00
MADRHSSQSEAGHHEELGLLAGVEEREARTCALVLLATVNLAKIFCGVLVLFDASAALYDGYLVGAWFAFAIFLSVGLVGAGAAGFWLSTNGNKMCMPTRHKREQLGRYFTYLAFSLVLTMWLMTYLAFNYSAAAKSFRLSIIGNWDEFYSNMPSHVHAATPACTEAVPVADSTNGTVTGGQECWDQLQGVYRVR